MGHPSRVVERLRLRAESESALRRAVPRLEDAFRTATLPDSGARLIFVRKLALGRLPAAASAQSLSRIVESRLEDTGWRPVHASSPAADTAPVVWFRDPLEAHQLAALRVIAGESVGAWFWPRAVPALEQATGDGEVLRAIAMSVAAREDAPAALPAWVAKLVAAGLEDRLIAALRPGDGIALLRAAALTTRSTPTRVQSPAHGDACGGRSRPAASMTALDDRHDGVERLSGRPQMRSAVGEALHDTRTKARVDGAQRDYSRPIGSATARHALASPRHERAPRSLPALSKPSHMRDRGNAGAAGIEADRASAALASRAGGLWPEAVPTEAGGLLFLIPALEHLGFGTWSREVAHQYQLGPDALARQVFHLLLSRLQVADDDPAWHLASPLDVPEAALAAEPWLGRCRQLLRRRVRLGLATLVMRPARITLTETHADLFFSLTAIDVRIRREGLDVDPGWVPWLAKVVSFHYGDRR